MKPTCINISCDAPEICEHLTGCRHEEIKKLKVDKEKLKKSIKEKENSQDKIIHK